MHVLSVCDSVLDRVTLSQLNSTPLQNHILKLHILKMLPQVHFNEAIRRAVEEKDRKIQELELSLSSQVRRDYNLV